jgi:hypothetical protein
MFNLVTRSVIAIGLVTLLTIIVYVLARLTGITASRSVLPDTYYDPPEQDDEETEDDDEETEDPYDNPDISYPDMALRLTYPHLYSEQWYEDSRRELSRWVVEQYRLQAAFRREMGLAA